MLIGFFNRVWMLSIGLRSNLLENSILSTLNLVSTSSICAGIVTPQPQNNPAPDCAAPANIIPAVKPGANLTSLISSISCIKLLSECLSITPFLLYTTQQEKAIYLFHPMTAFFFWSIVIICRKQTELSPFQRKPRSNSITAASAAQCFCRQPTRRNPC